MTVYIIWLPLLVRSLCISQSVACFVSGMPLSCTAHYYLYAYVCLVGGWVLPAAQIRQQSQEACPAQRWQASIHAAQQAQVIRRRPQAGQQEAQGWLYGQGR